MKSTTATIAPFLNWHFRMGKHEAVHLNPLNRIIHWTCIPCQIFATFLFFSNLSLSFNFILYENDNGIIVIPFNLSLVIWAGLCGLYFFMDLFGGALTVLFWTPLLVLSNFIHQNSILGKYEYAAALIIFIVTFSIQVGVGHLIFEEGRDDTEQNVAEFLSTWNPVYISCIPFYHHMEIVFNLGLRSEILEIVRKHQYGEKNI